MKFTCKFTVKWFRQQNGFWDSPPPDFEILKIRVNPPLVLGSSANKGGGLFPRLGKRQRGDPMDWVLQVEQNEEIRLIIAYFP